MYKNIQGLTFLFQMNVNFSKSLTTRPELLTLYNEHVMPKPQRKIFCKKSEKSKHSVSPVKESKHSVSPVKDDSNINRKRPTDSPTKEGSEELTRKKFKKITFP